MAFKHLVVFAPALALVLTGLGCGPVATPGVQVNSSGTSTVYTDQESGATVTVGDGASIPDDFPSEVPIYVNASVQQVATVADGATLLFTSKDSAATVTAWYEAQLTASGWVRSASYSAAGQETRVYTKGEATISVTATASEEESSTLVIWVPKG